VLPLDRILLVSLDAGPERSARVLGAEAAVPGGAEFGRIARRVLASRAETLRAQRVHAENAEGR
jgi:hypothetical protein